MNGELLALGRRAVACEGWRWMPGMLAHMDELVQEGARIVKWHEAVTYVNQGDLLGMVQYCEDAHGFDDSKALPDLSDPATVGCIDHLLEELHGAPVVALPFGRTWRAWRVLPPDRDGNDYTLSAICNGVTPIAARVAALEAAPKVTT